jgi:hypothetical protein
MLPLKTFKPQGSNCNNKLIKRNTFKRNCTLKRSHKNFHLQYCEGYPSIVAKKKQFGKFHVVCNVFQLKVTVSEILAKDLLLKHPSIHPCSSG